MAGKSTALENQLLLHIFNNSAIADIGNAAGLPAASIPGSLYVSLHTGVLTDGSAQTVNETTYTNYARVAVARSGAGWTVTANSVSPAADIDFAECGVTAGAALTHFAIGKEASGGGEEVLYWGALTPNITMATGVIPRIKTTSTVTED